jgi:hypothetical protein
MTLRIWLVFPVNLSAHPTMADPVAFSEGHGYWMPLLCGTNAA